MRTPVAVNRVVFTNLINRVTSASFPVLLGHQSQSFGLIRHLYDGKRPLR